MSVYELIVLIHIAAAVGLLSGSVIGSPGVRAAIQRARTVQELRAYLAIGRPLLMLEPISAVLVLATGAYLTSVGSFWSQGWVLVAVACWVMNSAIAAVLVKPAIGRLASRAATSTDGPVGRDLDEVRSSRGWSFGGDVLMANDAAMLYLMTIKPELAGSLLVVVVANAVVVAARAGRRVRRPRGAAGLAPEG